MDEELIERLAKEAGAQEVTGEVCGIPLRTQFLADHQIAKFAALVAEECATIAENTLESDCDENDKFATSAAAAIRTKFPAPANTPKE